METEKLIELYHRYGFETKKANSDIAVFGIQQGRYYGVDIIPLSEFADIKKAEEEYKEMGYAVTSFPVTTFEQIDASLFESFFSYNSTISILKSRHDEYIRTRSEKLGINYEYISCPYSVADKEHDEIDLDERILKNLSDDGPQLIILEAAASYGKTATSYQVLNKMLLSKDRRTPLFSELYKNRQARIFRHILLDEKEHLFPHLKAELVIEEIKNGRVPVIIDGFDELLLKSKGGDSSTDSFEEIGSMLATIGELLERNAKILLTSRKTAIFAGDDFYGWMDQNADKFSITRYEIHRPDIPKWIGFEKFKSLEKSRIPIEDISSPVLLSHIKNMSEDEFQKKCGQTDQLINDFFEKILTREQDRQDLNLNKDNQLLIIRDLASVFAYFGITTEHKSFVVDLILERHQKLLSETLATYPLTKRPTLEELVEKLSNHALLDRIGNSDDNIGFLNDFILGYLVGESALEANVEWLSEVFSNEKFVNLATSSLGVLKNIDSELLYEQIDRIIAVLSSPMLLIAEKNLRSNIENVYEGQTFDGIDFNGLVIEHDTIFRDCVFNECTFENVTIYKKALVNVSFTACVFKNCFGVEDGVAESGAWFFGCNDYEANVIKSLKFNGPTPQPAVDVDEFLFEKEVLRNICPKGRPNVAIKRPIRTLFQGIRPDKKAYVPSAIANIVRLGFINIKGRYAYIVKEKMADINKFLGDK